jgi:hypothetical protein
MNTVTIANNQLIVEPLGLDKVWSFTRELDIPLAHVRGATFDPEANSEPKGIRAPGLSLPGKWAGTFHKDGETAFWNVSAPASTIEIELTDEHFARLYLTVENPRGVVDAINSALPGTEAR